jgi:asparagine synthase (glutamine-hydrolysing)
MCGISGIINRNSKAVDRADIEAMNDLIVHRGPDDEGFFFGDNFAFGHRRLSIIDLSPEAHQPMTHDGKYTIAYNGEVYNYIEIKEELRNEGYVFRTKSDTEVILAAYDRWGYDCVKRFNGMWAFAIFDRVKNVVFCSRDRFGVKPFYYTEIDGRFVFGSEIKQLLLFMHDRHVNKKILMDYFILGFEEHTHETFFESIYKLPQSHHLIYDLKAHCFHLQQYYFLAIEEDINKLNEFSAVNAYREKLIAGIRLRLRSDVKVGTCLSGGLDSSSVAALASRFYGAEGKFLSIHAKSSEWRSDESKFAVQVADHCGLDLHVIEPSKNDFLGNIDEIIYKMEEPFIGPSVFMQYFVMKKAKELDCKVMLDGQGGDETLLGYERYFSAFLLKQSLLKKIKMLFSASKNSKCSIKELILNYIYFSNAKIILLRHKIKSSFVKKKYFNLISKPLLGSITKSYKDIAAMQMHELFHAPLPSLLKYADKNSMQHSIEIRLPFIDFKTAETALSINEQYKIKDGWTKYALRKAIVQEHTLPDEIAWRRDKLGFEAPDSAWISVVNDQLPLLIRNSKILSEIVKNKSINLSKLDNRQKWKLFNIAKWEKLYHVGIQ